MKGNSQSPISDLMLNNEICKKKLIQKMTQKISRVNPS